MKSQADRIKAFLLKKIPKHPNDVVALAAHHFGVTRTTILRHINKLISDHLILKSGTTKQTTYSLREDTRLQLCLPINSKLDEFLVFEEYLSPILKKFANTNAYEICEYGVTEMVNNAKDHSAGRNLTLISEIKNPNLHLQIADDGIGIFEKIMQTFQYDTYPEIILDLTKGKLTTDPTKHTGEGIFFTSRSFDFFSITANGYQFFIDNLLDDWSFKKSEKFPGTTINLIISLNSQKRLIDYFKTYQSGSSLEFNRTDIKVELAKLHGERLISRSQAKRILRNLEQFTSIELDFKNVVAVGQGFVDEIFRVYQLKNPQTTFHYRNANDEIDFMIKRSITRKS